MYCFCRQCRVLRRTERNITSACRHDRPLIAGKERPPRRDIHPGRRGPPVTPSASTTTAATAQPRRACFPSGSGHDPRPLGPNHAARPPGADHGLAAVRRELRVHQAHPRRGATGRLGGVPHRRRYQRHRAAGPRVAKRLAVAAAAAAAGTAGGGVLRRRPEPDAVHRRARAHQPRTQRRHQRLHPDLDPDRGRRRRSGTARPPPDRRDRGRPARRAGAARLRPGAARCSPAERERPRSHAVRRRAHAAERLFVRDPPGDRAPARPRAEPVAQYGDHVPLRLGDGRNLGGTASGRRKTSRRCWRGPPSASPSTWSCSAPC